ncbi:Retrotransposon gag domain [Sesbania bispinosa]|nr:Retrotransposon gag domain [Sesbania bispinosa]
MAEIVHPTPETEDKSLTAGELQNIHSAYRLNGKNYLKWSQLIRTILKGKGKGSHLTNNAPDEKDAKFKSWDEEDSMIIAWLWNSMIPEISDICMFLKSAKEIWEAVEQTYSKAKDAAQIYEVKVKTMGAKQGNKSITEYANQLKSLWMELDHYRVIKTRCSEDSAILKEYIEQDRVYDFLVGLNPEYDQKGGPQKGGGQGQAHIVNGKSEEPVQLNHEEIERVRSLVNWRSPQDKERSK